MACRHLITQLGTIISPSRGRGGWLLVYLEQLALPVLVVLWFVPSRRKLDPQIRSVLDEVGLIYRQSSVYDHPFSDRSNGIELRT